MKRVCIALALMLSMAAPAFAVDFTFNGDLNHRFRMFTNQASMYSTHTTQAKTDIISEDDDNDFMGEIKYRLWTTASSDNGAIKGSYAIEVGGVQFGDGASGGGFSGDGKNVETRWAYTDFALGGGRTRVGLFAFTPNKFLWWEMATGVRYTKDGLELAWMRGYEDQNAGGNDFKDLDALFVGYDLKPAEDVNLHFFALWQTSDADKESDTAAMPSLNYAKTFSGFDLDLYTLGVDGSLKSGDFFANWDLMYQFGDFKEEYDFGGYFIHADAGVNVGKGKFTATAWYASGDDDSTDGDLDAFVSTDVDINSEYSVVLFEGYTDDDYFSARPYIQDKGMILTRLGYDYQMTDKLKIGAAALYMMTAEDLEYVDDNGDLQKNDEIGVEVDAYASYKLFSNTEVAIQMGYLAAGDAMDYYEVECDGSSDEDIYTVNSRIRYKF